MLTAYMYILCISAALASWTSVRITRRLESMIHTFPVPTGLFIALSALGFLIIVAVPPKLVVGGLLLFGMGLFEMRSPTPIVARLGVPLIAVILGLSTLHHMPATAEPLPGFAWLAVGLGWYVITLSGHLLPDHARQGCGAIAMVLIPLASAPLYTTTPEYLTVDCALLIAPLLGGVYAHRKGGHLGMLCRLPYAFMIGWLMLVTLMHKGYISVAVSATLWLVVYYYHAGLRLRKKRHAPQV